MPKPTLHFVWVGPPKFDKGGQDVIGLETIYSNFMRYQKEDHNPIVFWCQGAHKSNYEHYFGFQAINITVSSIEDELNHRLSDDSFSEEDRQQTQLILEIYTTLTSPLRSKILDFVNIKDLYFNYILSTQGGYVLDTTLRADPDIPVKFPEYANFHYPLIGKRNHETWIQYAPKDAERSKKCLASYLILYQQMVELVGTDYYSATHHQSIGYMGVGALRKSSSLKGTLRPTSLSDDCSRWMTEKILLSEYTISELGITKEYYNSHVKNIEESYIGAHAHTYIEDVIKLRADLDHGVHPDVEANPRHVATQFGYDANNETLLHIAMRNFNHGAFPECVALLLERGADPNKVHQIGYIRPIKRFRNSISFQEESPLTYAIKSGQERALKMLFSLSRSPVNLEQIVDGETPLMLAIDHEPGFEFLLEQGASPNTTVVPDGESPLSRALNRRAYEKVRLLLEKGANVTQVVNGETPLMIALRISFEIDMLLKFGASPNAILLPTGETALWGAIRMRCESALQPLIDHGADLTQTVRGRTLLVHAVRHRTGVELLLSHGLSPTHSSSEESPLFAALKGSDFITAELLLKHGANIEQIVGDETLLMWAVRENRCAVRWLLKHRASLTATAIPHGEHPFFIAFKAAEYSTALLLFYHGAYIEQVADGNTPLMWAIKHKKGVEWLLKYGASPNTRATTEGESPLSLALKAKDLKTIKRLLDLGARIEAVAEGETPLMLAIRYETGVELLLKRGASPNASGTPRGESPLSLALKAQDLKTLKLLLKQGANPLVPYTSKEGKEIPLSELETSLECRAVLADKIKKSRRLSTFWCCKRVGREETSESTDDDRAKP